MAYTCFLLIVLTLLQLCRAEISDALPENWYSANVINNDFQPKPLSEIFSTETPFSTSNPIVVLPNEKSSSLSDDLVLLSTLPPPQKTSDFSSPSQFSSSVTTTLPPTLQTLPPADYSHPPSSPQVEITQYTEQTQPPSSPIYVPDLQTTLGLHPTLFTGPPSTITQSTLAPPSQQRNTQMQQIRLNFAQQYPNQQDLSTTLQQIQTSSASPVDNFLNYQQSSQSIQDQLNLLNSQGYTVSTPSTVVIHSSSNSGSSTHPVSSTSTTPLPSTLLQKFSTHLPSTGGLSSSTANPPPSGQLPSMSGAFPIRIRVVSPSGSITNVNFNPIISTTTKKPTTTRKPTTKKPRTPKPKKNNYDTCLDGCKGKREPICAVPLASSIIDPETLKGFPSVCHMACHNSYRKEPYEKILDGRCGRLRTRIKTVDNTKLKRDELQKSQYIIDNGSKTIVEFQALH